MLSAHSAGFTWTQAAANVTARSLDMNCPMELLSRKPRLLVIVESPYAGEVETNETYARNCLRDSLERGEAPFASHLLYTQKGVLDDLIPEERQWGIDAGLQWALRADMTAVYIDLGISRGMQYGIDHAVAAGRPIDYRRLNR